MPIAVSATRKMSWSIIRMTSTDSLAMPTCEASCGRKMTYTVHISVKNSWMMARVMPTFCVEGADMDVGIVPRLPGWLNRPNQRSLQKPIGGIPIAQFASATAAFRDQLPKLQFAVRLPQIPEPKVACRKIKNLSR